MLMSGVCLNLWKIITNSSFIEKLCFHLEVVFDLFILFNLHVIFQESLGLLQRRSINARVASKVRQGIRSCMCLSTCALYTIRRQNVCLFIFQQQANFNFMIFESALKTHKSSISLQS